MIYTLREFEGYAIAASDGPIGSVKDIYFDDDAWIVRYFVVETGSWLNGRRVLLSASNLTAVPTPRWLTIGASREQVRQCPSVETELPVSRQRERELFTYYGWTPYWGISPLGDSVAPSALVLPPTAVDAPSTSSAAGARVQTADRAPTEDGDPHLRSVREVRGYSITASDGSIGKLEDLLVDSDTWHVRALAVDTRKWLPGGRTVLIPPPTVAAVRWTETDLVVDLTREEIKNGPVFDPDQAITADSTDRLLSHYSRQVPKPDTPEIH